MSPPLPLVPIRLLIDAVDAGVVALFGVRRVLARSAATVKRIHHLPAVDPVRESAVHDQLRRCARPLGVRPATADALAALMIDDGRDAQRLALVPDVVQCHVLETALGWLLAQPVAAGDFDFLGGRRIAIEVTDARLRWVVTLRDARLCACPSDQRADATVRGRAADLVMLAGRVADADTLFFERRLIVTGDTALGLEARNLLDRLPWESVPRIARTALQRIAGALRDREDYAVRQ